jgi:preprotein translocase subunit SecB
MSPGNLSPLQLRSFRLVHLRVDANENYLRLFDEKDPYYDISTDFDVLKTKDKMIFRIPFAIHMVGKSRNCKLKRLDIEIEGIFSLPDALAEETVESLVPYNCIAILYSLSRGLVSNVTGNIRGGSLLLPTLDFTNVISDKINRMKAEKKGTGKAIKVLRKVKKA